MQDLTLGEVLTRYLDTQPLKDKSKYLYGHAIHRYCGALLFKSVHEITPETVAKYGRLTRRAGGNHCQVTSILELLLRYAAKLQEPLEKKSLSHLKPEELTLSVVLADYIDSGHMKPATERNYRQRFTCYLSDWMHLPVVDITKQMVQERHQEISNIGEATANSVFRNLRTILNFASVKYEDGEGMPLIRANPCRRLTELKLWHSDKRRTSVIQMRQIGPWFRAVWALEHKTARDILLLLLVTGLRHNEIQGLEWSQVDLKLGTLTIPEEKSKNNKALIAPLSDFAWRLLADRRVGFLADVDGHSNKYVFPGKAAKRAEGYISNIDKSIRTVKRVTGIQFMCHDLRRTFITVGDELDINVNLVKNLVNHGSRDVTEGYRFDRWRS